MNADYATERAVRDANRIRIFNAEAELLRDTVLWLNAANPHLVEAALNDSKEEDA